MSTYKDIKPSSVQSLRPLGAVPVKNEKGEITMQKVKVQRYVSGRKPKYAEEVDSSGSESNSYSSEDELKNKNRKLLPSLNRHQNHSSMAFTLASSKNKQTDDNENKEADDSDDDDDDIRLRIRKNRENNVIVNQEKLYQDPRMRRLMQFREQSNKESSRPTIKPQVIKSGQKSDQEESDPELEHDEDGDVIRRRHRHREVIDAEENDDENADENIERRHELLKQRVRKLELESAPDEAFSDDNDNDDEDDDDEEESENESEYSEDEAMPRLKPIFVSKKDRITINEKEEQERKRIETAELEAKIALEERRRSTLKLIEEDRRREEEEREKNKAAAEEEAIIKGIASVITDDEDDETAFELWKVRELRRIKREKEEEEQRERERREIERLRNMTEEERQEELKKNPRVVTNQQKKGKYKFLQKYYHRGAFYLDEEDQVFKRDFAQPTLEDHFDKSVLPSVMQVKNFGRAGRTKYTHLTDVDTTAFDSAWSAKDNTHAIQFHQAHGGGMKQSFERPGKRKK
ncbi:microfibrillar-associated protein 1 [Dermatophagoides farinae]|uniref:Microfibrillar-associated protein 1 n=1 Tax=Dermatophagoides farinae TaxID=6954 RepID=A0A922KVI5_DERFA|nr:microfibrillar-associated protein 1-like [Dermatophagoides farinae]KAH7645523.1 microfibrillar-associated protein 1-like protein [Dermatophagoides farinae]KAH9497611.1 Microfibrillar-associated protein 1 [Dermatophagoides farinae]